MGQKAKHSKQRHSGPRTALALRWCEWLVSGLEETGKTRTGLAEALGTYASEVTHMTKGKRVLNVDEILTISRYLGRPIPLNLIGHVIVRNGDTVVIEHAQGAREVRKITVGADGRIRLAAAVNGHPPEPLPIVALQKRRKDGKKRKTV